LKLLYPKDIRFECQRCGRCCGDTIERERKVLMLEMEVERISKVTNLKPEEFSTPVSKSWPYGYTMRKQNGKCIFLKDAVCQIYNYRPLLCRFFPFCLEQVGDKSFKFIPSDECTGIGVGEIVEEKIFMSMLTDVLKVFKDVDRLKA
jgi:Fe-S-cluster containining protein